VLEASENKNVSKLCSIENVTRFIFLISLSDVIQFC